MKDFIIALVDCDSFFVSCEQALNKDLQGKPVCVLSNNDACVIARSKEAKKMGIKMGMPYVSAKKQYPEGIYVSGNISVYRDFSKKVMAILSDYSPNVEVYSIDEAFLDFSGLKKVHKQNYYKLATSIRKRIKTELDINVSIGVSKTKALSKLACEKAKSEGCGVYLIGKSKIKKLLPKTKVGEIWGIGRQLTNQFNRRGILVCSELTAKSDEWLKLNFGKNGVEIKHELLGESIYRVKPEKKLPKSIQNTRSFQKATNDLSYIKNALNIHIHTSCTKLRRLNGKCKTVVLMLKTKDFEVFTAKRNLEELLNFELEISREVIKMLNEIYNPQLIYRSCGVTLENLSFDTDNQLNLFASEKDKNFDKLASALDKLEEKFGKNVVKTGFTWENFEE